MSGTHGLALRALVCLDYGPQVTDPSLRDRDVQGSFQILWVPVPHKAVHSWLS